jgi:uncharacterized protein GlcG (DUF336 family)
MLQSRDYRQIAPHAYRESEPCVSPGQKRAFQVTAEQAKRGAEQLCETGGEIMNYKRDAVALTQDGALAMIAAAAARAGEMKVPQCIVIVDASGETIASLRMDGAKYLSMQTARAKARTAASINNATGAMAPEFALQAGIATGGGVTGLMGGLPIRFSGKLAGGIGIGSGKGEEDVDVARAALKAVGADDI